MSGDMRWYVEGRILYIREHGVLTQSDLETTNAHLWDILAEAEAYSDLPLHLVIDQLDLEHRPPNIDALKDSLSVFAHSIVGWTVIVSPDNPRWRFLSGAAQQFTTANIIRVDSVEDAFAFLMDEDRSLPDLFASSGS